MKKLGIKTQTSISNLDGRSSMTFQQKLDH